MALLEFFVGCPVVFVLLLVVIVGLFVDAVADGGIIHAALRNKCQQAARCPPLITSHQ